MFATTEEGHGTSADGTPQNESALGMRIPACCRALPAKSSGTDEVALESASSYGAAVFVLYADIMRKPTIPERKEGKVQFHLIQSRKEKITGHHQHATSQQCKRAGMNKHPSLPQRKAQ